MSHKLESSLIRRAGKKRFLNSRGERGEIYLDKTCPGVNFDRPSPVIPCVDLGQADSYVPVASDKLAPLGC